MRGAEWNPFMEIGIWIWYAEGFQKKIKEGWVFSKYNIVNDEEFDDEVVLMARRGDRKEILETPEDLDAFLE